VEISAGLNLDDSEFNILGTVDMLLWADVFGKLLKSGHVIRVHCTPAAMETVLV
jgi:hypothetical protein